MKRLTTCFCALYWTLSLGGCSAPDAPGEASGEDGQIDLIIRGDYVVSMDEAGTIVENGAVAVDENMIVAIGTADQILADYSAAQILEGEKRIVMPGLVNGHSHAAMTLLRGVA
ncbi:MAG: hypothetical protein WBN44_07735, partial [Woeseiaceae bacterium]